MEVQRPAAIDQPFVQVIEEEPLLCERMLVTSIVQLDELVGGFRASKVALFDSDNSYSSTLMHLLCVRAISQFDEEAVMDRWRECGRPVLHKLALQTAQA